MDPEKKAQIDAQYRECCAKCAESNRKYQDHCYKAYRVDGANADIAGRNRCLQAAMESHDRCIEGCRTKARQSAGISDWE